MSRGCLFNEITKINEEYSLLRIKSVNPANPYDLTTLIDTKHTELLSQFNWGKISTNTGYYFSSRADKKTHRKYIEGKYPFEYQKQILLHRLIAYHIDNPELYLTVDHINREPLDNREKNLRWATSSLQCFNRDKVPRNKNAKPLPEEIVNEDIPKYVTWMHGITESGKEKHYFLIRDHPALEKGKRWETTKSLSVSLIDKLNQAREKRKELDKLIPPDPEQPLRHKLLEEFNNIIKMGNQGNNTDECVKNNILQ
jgi:hypothetical protein